MMLTTLDKDCPGIVLPKRSEQVVGEVDNLAELNKLSNENLLENLRVRFANDVIYSYIGEILVSVNPFKRIEGLYDSRQSGRYTLVGNRNALPPHVFAIADIAFQNFVNGGKDQTCIISGESGAGKTEAAKLFVKHLVYLSKGTEIDLIHKQLVDINPLLEAFGNAQTLRNANSSRFGKFTQIIMEKDGSLTGAVMSHYLLEKSRVVQQARGEKNFHAFYLMFAGLNPAEQEAALLYSPGDYRFINKNHAAIEDIHTTGSVVQARELMDCISFIGFSDEEQASMWKILSGILLMGNLDFTNEDSSHVCGNPVVLDVSSTLFGVEAATLELALTRTIVMIRGEETEKHYKKIQAEDCRNATAKDLYHRLFSWIFTRCNQLLGPEQHGAKSSSARGISILDIFGFECFKRNSFEQLCINLANEQLQYFFNEHVFRIEMAEYASEGIDQNVFQYTDNKPVLDIFLLPKRGLISILDEVSGFAASTDASLVSKLHTQFEGSPLYTRPRGDACEFTVRHFAGEVKYQADGFLYKNRDTLPLDVVGALRDSTHDLVRNLYRDNEAFSQMSFINRKSRVVGGARSRVSHKVSRRLGGGAMGGGANIPTPSRGTINPNREKKYRESIRTVRQELAKKSKMTVATGFKKDLSALMAKLNVASPHFIRCLKPNDDQLPGTFEPEMVMKQLQYTGMLETTRIRREGFSYRPSFADFVTRYGVLAYNTGVDVATLPLTRESCEMILRVSFLDEYIIGKSKVFLRYTHVDLLNDHVRDLHMAAVSLQRLVKGFRTRCYVARLVRERHYRATVLQKCVRGYVSRRRHRVRLNISAQQAKASAEVLAEAIANMRRTYAVLGTVCAADLARVESARRKEAEEKLRASRRSGMDDSGCARTSNCSSMKTPNSNKFMQFETSTIDIGDEDDDDAGSGGTIHRAARANRSIKWFVTQEKTKGAGMGENGFEQWFHGVLSRRESERHLVGQPQGTYLVRVAESRFGYSLSVVSSDGKVKHFMINVTDTGNYKMVGNSRLFLCLNDIVFYHESHAITKAGDTLVFPCPQTGENLKPLQ